jgi:hypothetical protein
MAFRLTALALATLAFSPVHAATVFEIDNTSNNTLAGAQEILAGDTAIIGYRGLVPIDPTESFLDDESIDFYKFDFLSEGLTLLLDLTIEQADIDAFRQPPTMNLYVDDGLGGFDLLASPNLISTGSFISWLVDIAGPFYLGVSGSAYEPGDNPDFPLPKPFDTDLTYIVSVQAVPVPAAVWMLSSAIAATGLASRRRA